MQNVLVSSLPLSDAELTSATTTPSSLYTDADEEESFLSTLEEGDFETALRLLPNFTSRDDTSLTTAPLRIGPTKLTPLHYACQHSRLDVLEVLVREYSYDLNQLNREVPTPLQVAAASGSANVVEYLLQNTEKVAFRSGRVNPFHLAADNGHISIMSLLLSFSSSLLSMVDHDGNTPLHHACAHGCLPVVVFLCSEVKHPLVVRNKQGETPLHLATKHCHSEVVKYLIDEKLYDPTTKDSVIGSTPLHMAAKSGCLDIMQYLANEKGCNFECKTSHQKKGKAKNMVSGRTPLHYACYGGQCDVAKFLIEDQSCNPCCTDDQGYTPLHLACQEGHAEVVRYLLSLKDTEIHQMVNDDGLTPIHAASLSGNLEILKLLVTQNEGNPSSIDSEGRSALHYCSRRGHTDLVRYLVQDSGLSATCTDQSNITPLHLAAQYGHLNTVKFLVTDALANANVTEESGYTPLHLAANKGHLTVVEFFLSEHHVSCMVRDRAGRTPLHHACQSGHLHVVQYLASQPDCDPSCQEKNLKAMPLHLAASFGHLEIVKYLMEERNCSPTCTDKFNSTPIHRAAANGHCDIVSYFVKGRQCHSILKNKFGNTPLHLACQQNQVQMVELLLSFSKENMTSRNQVGRMPMDLTENIKVLSIFLKNGFDPSKGSIATKFPYLKCWDPLSLTVKIFLLGDLDSGKSTLAKALQGGGFFQEWVTGRFQRVTPPDLETSGIIPISFGSKHFGRVILYDFAGHPSYHASHSVIMDVASRGSSPIFLIAVDLRKAPELIEKSVAYWCSLIELVSNGKDFQPHPILVGTHEDELSKDGLRHKQAILEKLIALSVSTSLEFSSWVTIDCRKPNLANFHKLRQYISQGCDGLHPSALLDHKSCLLRSFMLHKFQGTSVIEFHELLEYLSHTNIPDIKDKDEVYKACQSLHSYGYILFLESKGSMESSWIVHNQEAILSMVHGFHKLVEIPNPLGLVSLTQLQTGLGAMGFNVTLAIRYLVRMEFCVKLADRRILHSVSGFDPPHPLEDHLFFPHLIRSSVEQEEWVEDDAWGGHFGWCMKCVDSNQMLGPRFLQLLLLRVASRFCFNTDPNSPFHIRRSSCVIWRTGIAWCDSRGIEAVVGLQDKNRVTFFSRVQMSAELELDFYHFRSSVIREVRQVRMEACSSVRVDESVIHPGTILQCTLKLDSSKMLRYYRTVNISDVFSSLVTPDEASIAWECSLESEPEESTETALNESLTWQDVLEFEPLTAIPSSILTKIACEESKNEQISKEDFELLSRSLSDGGTWDLKQLLIVLSLPRASTHTAARRTRNDSSTSLPPSDSSTSSFPLVPASSFQTVFDRWSARRNGERTYIELWDTFSQYSMFGGGCCHLDADDNNKLKISL